MKVIDLLNKIANGDIPKKIKYKNVIYEYDNYKGENSYVNMTQVPYKWFEHEIDCDVQGYLNDEVEILEEEPRDIEVCGNWFTKSEYDKLAHNEEPKGIPEKLYEINNIGDLTITYPSNKELMDKINEILDYLESKGE